MRFPKTSMYLFHNNRIFIHLLPPSSWWGIIVLKFKYVLFEMLHIHVQQQHQVQVVAWPHCMYRSECEWTCRCRIPPCKEIWTHSKSVCNTHCPFFSRAMEDVLVKYGHVQSGMSQLWQSRSSSFKTMLTPTPNPCNLRSPHFVLYDMLPLELFDSDTLFLEIWKLDGCPDLVTLILELLGLEI